MRPPGEAGLAAVDLVRPPMPGLARIALGAGIWKFRV